MKMECVGRGMRMIIKQKQINTLLLLLLFIFLCTPSVIIADNSEGDELEKGKFKIKSDRIIENDNESEQLTTETELEKTFPTLFRDETKQKIVEKQEKERNRTTSLKRDVFSEDFPDSSAIYDIKSTLFTDEYEYVSTEMNDEKESKGKSSSVALFGGVVSLIGFIVGGIFIFSRNSGS